MTDTIVNKVAESGLVSFDLEEYYLKGTRSLLDIKGWLFEGLLLKEKDFRNYVKDHDWSQYQDHYVAVTCGTDAIVPTWAYMLIVTKLEPYTKQVVFGNLTDLRIFFIVKLFPILILKHSGISGSLLRAAETYLYLSVPIWTLHFCFVLM